MDPAIAAVRDAAPWPAQVIVEAETEAEAMAAVAAGANGVLLDEFRPEVLCDLVPRLRQLALQRPQPGAVVLEASGIQPSELRAEAMGIDLISTSAPVTRSAWLISACASAEVRPTSHGLNAGDEHVGDLSTPSKSDSLMLHSLPGLVGDECALWEIDLLLHDSDKSPRSAAL